MIFERGKFNLGSQKENELLDNFITDLYCLTECCEFGTQNDRIVVWLKDKKLSEEWQLESKLTLEKAITKSRHSKIVEKQQILIQGNTSEPQPASVDRLSKGKKKMHAKERDQKNNLNQSTRLRRTLMSKILWPTTCKETQSSKRIEMHEVLQSGSLDKSLQISIKQESG